MQKILSLCAHLMLFQCSFGQQQIPVFAAKQDSVAHANVQAEIQRYFAAESQSRNPNRIDSLFQIQRDLRSKILGFKTIFKPDPEFTPFDSLKSGKLNASQVTRLSFSGKSTRKLPSEIFSCANLFELEILNSSIQVLPRKLRSLKNLKAIYIYNNGAPIKLKKNTSITGLVIRGTEQKNIPKSYKRLMALDSLDLSRNIALSQFPDIYKNNHLTKVILIENILDLKDLKSGNAVPSLQELHLQKNKIEVVPEGINRFNQLKKLSFNYNQINQVHPAIGQLDQLREISFYQNKLTEIPAGLFDLENLRIIDLYFNQITSVSTDLAKLKHLEILYLSNNQVTALPESIGQAKNLRALYVHSNKISYLPENLAELKDLRVLRINDNQFTTFPQPVLLLSELENLDVSRNNLRQFPIELGTFKNLQILALVENPWENADDLTRISEALQAQGTIVHK